MLFEMIFLLDSYSRRSLPGIESSSAGIDHPVQSGGLSCLFDASCLPGQIVVDGSKSFSFPGCSLIRIVSSTTPGSGSLVHGFTHDKSVPCLFSTCLDVFFGGSWEGNCKSFNINAQKPTFYSSTIVYFTLPDLLGSE